MYEIDFAEGAEETALCVMLAEIIKGNLEKKPAKVRLFRKLKTDVLINVNDVDIELMMSFRRGKLTFYGHKAKNPRIVIDTDSSTLLDLSNLKIKCGVPYLFDENGRNTMKKFVSGELKIKGLTRFPALLKLTGVLSVAD